VPRSRPDSLREVLEIDWAFFGELCRALALHVSRKYDPDIVIGIAKAGVIPAAIVATILQREFAAMVITRTSENSTPQIMSGLPENLRGRRVLLVDETCDSGDTLKLALNAIQGSTPAAVRTAVSFKTGAWVPDFHAFETDKAIILPWDREYAAGGELVSRDLSGDPAS
jgi:hypoxanthine phosphoribosyltransferase